MTIDKMDEFEAAGFDEETCEQLRKISEESGVEPCYIISAIRGTKPETSILSELGYTRLEIAWYTFKQKLWEVFAQSKIGKVIIRLADKLAAWLELLNRTEK